MSASPSEVRASVAGHHGVKVAGALSGTVFVPNLQAPVATLRQEIARLLGVSPQGVKLIVGGRSLQDGTKQLHECGVTPSSRVLVTAGAQAGSALQQVEAKQAQLEHVKRVLQRMSAVNAAVADQQGFQLENQRGETVVLKEEDRRAIVMGLALHDMGKAALAKGDYEQALALLGTADESFSVADKSLLAGIDNVGMLLLDYVWCCYKLGDARRLAVARERLVRCRQALEHAYGPGLQRLRQLHGSRCPELAVYTRLEALEAVSAYHAGDIDAAERLLQAARSHWDALQVSDLKLAQLGGMGYEPEEARRALKLSGGDIDAAITFITDQRIRQEEQQTKRYKEEQWRKERVKYGRTPKDDYVNEEYRDRLAGLGYDRDLAAFALRLLDNDVDAAVEALLDEMVHGFMLQALSAIQQIAAEAEGISGAASSSTSRPNKTSKAYKKLLTADAASTLAGLVASIKESGQFMDNDEIAVRLHSTLHSLMAPDKQPKQDSTATRATGAAGQAGAGGSSSAAAAGGSSSAAAAGGSSSAAAAGGSSSAAAAGAQPGSGGVQGEDTYMDEGEGDEKGEGSGRASDEEVERDVRAAVQSDAMASYDLDVQEEGELIQTYTALCTSARTAMAGASSSK